MLSRRVLSLAGVLTVLVSGAAWYVATRQDKVVPKSGLSLHSGDTGITYRYEDGPGNCSPDTPVPFFTRDITDTSRLARIIPPATVIERGELKTHSYLHIANGASVPIYAPVDGVIAWGTHVVQQNRVGKFDSTNRADEYSLFIEVDCDHYIMIDHLTDPVAAITAALPPNPLQDSRTQFLHPPVIVKAGDLLGETTGTEFRIWDFGVYDRRKKNTFPSSVRDASGRDFHAVCPYEFFDNNAREKYRRLYDKTYGTSQRVLDLCK
ncbi:MAG: hypothetical protein Q8R32_01720 [bacterium]|nr:hypothetical protein [bacterium]